MCLLLCLWGLACSNSASPVPMPAPIRDDSPSVQGRMVAGPPGVRGYLVRPSPPGEDAEIWWGDPREKELQSQAQVAATAGRVVFLSAPDAPDSARAYVRGLEGIAAVTEHCHTTDCPAAAQNRQRQ